MFERFTEKARRVIFFARYEASQFGSPYIETEQLLLGLLREDKSLANRFLHSHAVVESIRKQIEDRTVVREKTSTSVDLPLSHECKRALAYGSEESERLKHKHIDTGHLLLGLLREEKCFAAQLLREQGLTVDSVRDALRQEVPQQQNPLQRRPSASFAGLDQWLAELEARAGIWIVKQTNHFAIFEGDQPQEHEETQEMTPAEKLAQIHIRIDLIVEKLERAIGNLDFEKARLHSQEERKERENSRVLRERFNLVEPPPRVPVLCIEIIRDQRFSEVQRRCDDTMAKGVPHVWLLHPDSKRAYAVTKDEGLHEVKGGILRMASPPLEMDLSRIFD
jgi:hypothetical protein